MHSIESLRDLDTLELLDALRIRYDDVTNSSGYGDLSDHFLIEKDGRRFLISRYPPSLISSLRKSDMTEFASEEHEDDWQAVNWFITWLDDNGDRSNKCWELAYQLYCQYEEKGAPSKVSMIGDNKIQFMLVEQNCYFIEMDSFEIRLAVLKSMVKIADLGLEISEIDRRAALLSTMNIQVHQWLALAKALNATEEDIVTVLRSELCATML